MQLTKHTDLALRILMGLAVSNPAKIITARKLAIQFRAAPNHIAKIISKLSRLGLVETSRGRNGGLRLTTQGQEVSVGAVVRELEDTIPVVDCNNKIACPLAGGCSLQHHLAAAQEVFYTYLDNIFLKELIENPQTKVLLKLSSTTNSSSY